MASLGTLSVNIGANTRPLKQGLDSALSQAKSFASGVLQTFTGMQLSSMFTGAVQQLKTMAVSVVQLAADAEVAKAQFSTLLGDAGKGAKLFRDLEKFAARTSFNMQSASDAATMLMAKGVSESELLSTMQLLGDLAMGNAEKLGFIAKAYTDVQAKGRLMAQEQNQFAENGINLFELLAATTGKNAAELLAMREAGKISFGMVQQALRKATAQGGKFYKSLENANNTFTGQWNSLIEGVQTLGRMLGDMVLPRLKEIVTQANQLLQAFIEMPGKAEFLANVFIAAMDVAFAYIEQEWPKLLLKMGAAAAKLPQMILEASDPLGPIMDAMGFAMNAPKGVLPGKPLGDAQKRLDDLLGQLQARIPKAAEKMPVINEGEIMTPQLFASQMLGGGPLQTAFAEAVQYAIQNTKVPDLGEAIAEWLQGAKANAEPIVNGINTWLGGKLLKFDVAMAQIFGGKATRNRKDPIGQFAGAVQQGSVEAFQSIQAAIAQAQDPAVQATEEQTDKLLAPLEGILNAVKTGFVGKVVGNLLD